LNDICGVSAETAEDNIWIYYTVFDVIRKRLNTNFTTVRETNGAAAPNHNNVHADALRTLSTASKCRRSVVELVRVKIDRHIISRISNRNFDCRVVRPIRKRNDLVRIHVLQTSCPSFDVVLTFRMRRASHKRMNCYCYYYCCLVEFTTYREYMFDYCFQTRENTLSARTEKRSYEIPRILSRA